MAHSSETLMLVTTGVSVRKIICKLSVKLEQADCFKVIFSDHIVIMDLFFDITVTETGQFSMLQLFVSYTNAKTTQF